MVQDVLTVGDLVEADRENRHGLMIPLRVDKVERTPDHDWWAQLVHCSDVMGTHAKITIFDDDNSDLTEYSFEESCWYEFSDINPDVFQGTVGIKAKWARKVQQLRKSPEQSSRAQDNVVRQLGESGDVAALDIETITTVPERDLEPTNPDHQELLCIGVGYRSSPDAEVEVDVLFREDASPSAELKALEAAATWFEARDIEVLLTFGGAWFDLPVMVGRADRVATTLNEPERAENVRATLESFYHADLSATKNRVLGEGSLEDMANHVGSPAPKTHWTDYETGLAPENWRETQWEVMREDGRNPPSDEVADHVVFNSDVPYLGDAWLTAQAEGDHERCAALKECLETYTSADIRPLYAIADAEMSAGQPAFQMSY